MLWPTKQGLAQLLKLDYLIQLQAHINESLQGLPSNGQSLQSLHGQYPSSPERGQLLVDQPKTRFSCFLYFAAPTSYVMRMSYCG